MNYYKIISPQPKCKTCGKAMEEWNLFAQEHEHVECIADRISDHLIKSILINFNKNASNS
jgi:hypothetical protein